MTTGSAVVAAPVEPISALASAFRGRSLSSGISLRGAYPFAFRQSQDRPVQHVQHVQHRVTASRKLGAFSLEVPQQRRFLRLETSCNTAHLWISPTGLLTITDTLETPACRAPGS